MSSVVATPDLMSTAAADVANIGACLGAAHTAAAASTRSLLPAAADEVSATIANLFSVHAAEYQNVAEQADAFHQEFVHKLTASAGSYGSAEAANTAALLPANTAAGAAAIQIPAIGALYSVFLELIRFIQDPLGYFVGPIIGFFVNTFFQLFLRLLAVVIGSSIEFNVPAGP